MLRIRMGAQNVFASTEQFVIILVLLRFGIKLWNPKILFTALNFHKFNN